MKDNQKKLKLKVLMIISIFCFAVIAGLIITNSNKQSVYAASNTTYTVTYSNSSSEPTWSPSKPSTINGGDTLELYSQVPPDAKISLNVNLEFISNTMGGHSTYNALHECKVSTHFNQSKEMYTIMLLEMYNVEYNSNGGNGVTPTTETKYGIGESILLDTGTSLTRTNYTFKGWSTSPTATTGSVGSYTIQKEDIVSDKITFYAVWEANGHTITYDANGADSGSVPTDTTLYVKDDSITVLGNTGNLVKEGYIFSGWSTDSDYTLGYDYAVGSTYTMGDGDVTLYAKWVEAYSVIYDINGGSGTAPTDSNKYIDLAEVTLPSTNGLTKTGYHIVGWALSSNAGYYDKLGSMYTLNSFDADGDGNITIYAIWESDSYCETHHSQMSYVLGGTDGSKHQYYCSECAKSYGEGEAHDTDGEGGACSKCGCFSITYNLDGGTNGNNTKYYIPYNEYSFVDATKVGYIFDGWYFDESLNSSYKVTSPWSIIFITDINLYAKFDLCTEHDFDSTTHICSKCKIHQYSISFDDSVVDDSVTNMPSDNNLYTPGSLVTMPSSNPTRTGYKFMGWATSKYSSTPVTLTDNKYTMGEADTTFYAIWGHEHGQVGDTDYICFTIDLEYSISLDGGYLESGNYYLSKDITLDDSLFIDDGMTVNICLNGYVLNLNRYRILVDGSLSIYDCGTTVRYFTDEKKVDYDGNEPYGGLLNGIEDGQDGCYETYYSVEKPDSIKTIGGVITGGWAACKNYDSYILNDSRGGAIYISNYGELNLKGGNIVGNMACYGGAIFNIGRIYMYDGLIAGNNTENLGTQEVDYYQGSLGGAICNCGVMYMYGGAITNNNALNGGGIDNEWLLNIEGGTISYNKASDSGGGILNYYNQYKGIIVNITSGTISYNEASYGAGIYNDCVLNMSGGTISYNKTSNSGGGVYNYYEFNFSGGTISYNEAKYGAGIYDDGLLNMTGGTVSNNKGVWGAGVNAYGTVKLFGGEIKNNTITSEEGTYGEDFGGAGVDFYSFDTVYVGGKIVIKNNKTNGEEDNICIENAQDDEIYIYFDSEYPLVEGAYIGIRLVTYAQHLRFVSGWESKDQLKYFHSDVKGKRVSYTEYEGFNPPIYDYNFIDAYTITYKVDDKTSGDIPEDNNSYLPGETFDILSIGNVLRTGYKFLGWSINKDATTPDTFTNNKSTMGSSNVTLYAIWEEKANVVITETYQEYNYDKLIHSFELKGTNKDLSGFSIKYAVHTEGVHADSDWKDTITNVACEYDVKITRNEDGTYKSYSKVISKGLRINTVSVTLVISNSSEIRIKYGQTFTEPTATLSKPEFSSDITITKTYYKVIDLQSQNLVPVTEIKDVGDYAILFKTTTTNISLKSNDSKGVFVYISKADNEITFNPANIKVGETLSLDASSDFGTIKYQYRLVDTNTWNELKSNTLIKKQGTYEIKAYVEDNSNYNYNEVIKTISVSEKEIVNKDNTSESKGVLTEGSLDNTISLIIIKLEDAISKAIQANIKEAFNNKSEIIAKFDIHLEDQNGNKISNIDGNYYSITLIIPEELRSKANLGIVYIDDNGNVEKYNSIVDSNTETITFETNHFSTWAIVADSDSIGGFGIVLIILGSLILLFILLFIIWKIEYNKAKEKYSLEDRILKVFDIVFVPINDLLNKLLFK